MPKNYNNNVQGAGYINAVIPAKRDDEKNRVFFFEVNNTVTKTTYNVKVIAKDAAEADKFKAIGDECFENRRNAKNEGYEHKTHTMSFSGIFQPGKYNKDSQRTSPDTINAFKFELEPVLKDLKPADEKCEFAGNIMSIEEKDIKGKTALDVTIGVHFTVNEESKTEVINTLIFKNEKEGAFEQMKDIEKGDFIRIEGRMGSGNDRMYINPTSVTLLHKKGEKVAEAAEVKEAPKAAKAEKAEKKEAAEKKPAKRTSRKKGMSL